ncbi:hypothetical protein BXZ70DRAFT_1004417 [Cristinia sonorae]|uniref:Secreted protein n=1 Tax=Cristinia sonorae TaxID=1940300 RepID=A0A8K0UX97_9AGAR|nr:hypothetical protein BXZ70DRAFT_1004417 [Cristinia sonorae]
MLFMLVVSLFVALALCCLLIPSIWASITGDELLDAHEAGLALVASRNPVRETGPPACMAKLIMLRHKVSHPNSFACSLNAETALSLFRSTKPTPVDDVTPLMLAKPPLPTTLRHLCDPHAMLLGDVSGVHMENSIIDEERAVL